MLGCTAAGEWGSGLHLSWELYFRDTQSRKGFNLQLPGTAVGIAGDSD